ncbi:MAG: hypothetical protein KAJ19_03710 [Gammaproteobacteria bacterium]|nr:hypothetical protein [Gammaproteobacteria bacterium]
MKLYSKTKTDRRETTVNAGGNKSIVTEFFYGDKDDSRKAATATIFVDDDGAITVEFFSPKGEWIYYILPEISETKSADKWKEGKGSERKRGA